MVLKKNPWKSSRKEKHLNNKNNLFARNLTENKTFWNFFKIAILICKNSKNKEIIEYEVEKCIKVKLKQQAKCNKNVFSAKTKCKKSNDIHTHKTFWKIVEIYKQ